MKDATGAALPTTTGEDAIIRQLVRVWVFLFDSIVLVTLHGRPGRARDGITE